MYQSLDGDKFKFDVKVQSLKTYLILYFDTS